MQKQAISDIQEKQVIDTRLQHDFQKGSIKNALNIPYAKFEKVGPQLIDLQLPTVFILKDEEDSIIDMLEKQVEKLGLSAPVSYLLVDEIPAEQLVKTETIAAHDFLANEADYILLDVRDQDNVTKPAPEKNLVTISLENLADEYDKLDPEKEIYTLCGSGNSATTAASFLNKQGRKATIIEGGATAIQEELGKK